jgi:hypothetical protein
MSLFRSEEYQKAYTEVDKFIQNATINSFEGVSPVGADTLIVFAALLVYFKKLSQAEDVYKKDEKDRLQNEARAEIITFFDTGYNIVDLNVFRHLSVLISDNQPYAAKMFFENKRLLAVGFIMHILEIAQSIYPYSFLKAEVEYKNILAKDKE